MSISGVQGQLLEVTVVGCHKLKDTEWIARQDPYVCIEYGSSKFRTRTCTDGGKNPTFQEKFVLTLVEGLQEFKVVVWNSNTLTYDDLIGSGKIQLHKALVNGHDDSSWALLDKKGRHAGDIKLTMFYSNANRHGHVPSYPYYASTSPHVSNFPAHPLVDSHADRIILEPASYPSYPPNPAGYPPSPYDQPSTYPPAYPPWQPPLTSIYPPPQEPIYPPPVLYPPTTYPPPPQY